MRFDIITLFPELFVPFLTSGVTRRAYESGQVEVRTWNPRDYAEGQYRRVDDRPFGGGPGMVMLPGPLSACLGAIRAERADAAPLVTKTIFSTPCDLRVRRPLSLPVRMAKSSSTVTVSTPPVCSAM